MTQKNDKKIFEIDMPTLSKKESLEKIINYVDVREKNCHIVSLNPEIMMETLRNPRLKGYLQNAKVRLIDGVGMIIAARILGVRHGERYTGIDCMTDLLQHANDRALRVGLLGGSPKIANKVIECQQNNYPHIEFFASEGYKNIKNIQTEEEKNVEMIVATAKPHILFVAFGSPETELWLDSHRELLKDTVCMVVGGSFDFLAGVVPRAPKFIRAFGLEWLFRLIVQPWRLRRQVNLVRFIGEVLKRRFRAL